MNVVGFEERERKDPTIASSTENVQYLLSTDFNWRP